MSGSNAESTGAEARLWSSKEVASFLNLSPATLSRWRILKKGPPFIDLAGIARYRPNDVVTYVKENLK
jgi:hypothetical protein